MLTVPNGFCATWADRVVLAIVALLFVVPAAMLLLGPKPSRLGFQMYSGYGVVSATWQDNTGRSHPVKLDADVASPRAEIDWVPFLPEALCKRTPNAVTVEVRRTQPGGVERRSLRC